MSTVSDYYSARVDVAPFANGDADILYDLQFNDYSTASAFTTANPDWAAGTETNATFDTSGGLQVGASSSIASTTAQLETDLIAANEGSIYFEVERQGLAVDEADIPSIFIQSSGRTGTTTTDYLINTSGGSTNFIKVSRQPGVATAGQMRLQIKAGGGSVQNIDFYINSQRDFGVTDDEHEFAKIIITWKSKTVTVLVDGIPAITATLDNEFTTTTFSRFVIGNQALSSAGHFGGYFIRRMQLSKRQSLLVANPMRIGFLGDSFMLAFNDSADYDGLADLQALFDGTGRSGSRTGLASFINKFAKDHNFALTSITASLSCENGSGFSASIPNTIDSTQTDHIINNNPEILITAGSFNDVNLGTPAPDIYGDTLTVLNTIIDGCRALRQIHFFAQFAGFKGSTSTNNADHRAEAERLRGLQRALNGYKRNNAAGEPVTVFFHETYDLWGGDDYSIELSIGSATGNTVTANADIHPSSLGHIKMAEIMYNALEPYIATKPVLFE